MAEFAEGAVPWNDAAQSMSTPGPSFEEFFTAERERLFRVLCVVTGSRHDAEDIAQEAFARIWERWDSVGSMESPVGYLYRTSMNLFRNRYRRAVRAAKRRLDGPPGDDVFAAVDDREVVLQALRSLPPRQRAVVLLTDLLGFTAEEAGKMLGVRGSTVRASHFQARSTLKQTREAADV